MIFAGKEVVRLNILKIVSALLLCCMILPVVCNSVTALDTDEGYIEDTYLLEEQTTEEIYEEAEATQDQTAPEIAADKEKIPQKKNRGMSYSCLYDSKKSKIMINGTVSHEVFIKYRGYSIKLYKISPEQNISDVLNDPEVKPLASASISIKFHFTANIKVVSDIFSKYVAVLVSPEGQIDYIGPQVYPSVETTYTSEIDRKRYKGVVVSSDAAIYQSEPMVSIVPIHLERLLSSGSTGYLYSINNTNIFFNKEYIDELDVKVRNLYSGGSKIFFQLLLSSNSGSVLNSHAQDGGALYDIPDLLSVTVMNEIYSYCDFLSDRYSSNEKGYISGMIIGKNLDDTESYNNDHFENSNKYVETLALYGIIVGVATRKNIPSAEISYSFTNLNTFQDKHDSSLEYISSDMIERISVFFDEFYADDFEFSITLESYHRPLSINNEMLEDKIDISIVHDEKYVIERNLDVFSKYLNSLEKKYSSYPDSFMYVWNVDSELSGNALCCAYTYLYYKFFENQRLNSFIVSFEDNPKAMYDLLNVIKYIDTEKGTAVTSQLLHFFGEYSWENVVYDFDSVDFACRDQELFEPLEALPDALVGEFSHFDFSTVSSDKLWYKGSGIDSISIGYSELIGRSLCAKFNADNFSGIEYDYFFASYEYPENYALTPYLIWEFSIENDRKTSDIFEVKIAFEDSGSIYELSHIVHTGEKNQLILDISGFSKNHMVDNIRISLRPMSQASGEHVLYFSSLKGKSADYDDEELKQKIDEERLRIRNSSGVTDSIENKENGVIIVLSAIIVAVVLGVMLFFFLRRDEIEK